jgi:hypothetical protein
MARSYGTATLTLTVTEAITLNSKDEGQTHVHTIASIADVYRRTMTTSTSTDTSIVTFGSVFGVGQFVAADVKYLRISNLDDTNHVVLTFTNENSDEFAVKVDKGQSFILCPDLSGGLADVFDANQQALSFTDSTCDFTSGSTTVTCNSSSKIKKGQTVVSSGGAGTKTITAVNTAGAVTSFTINSAADGSTSNESATFTPGLSDVTGITAKADTGSVDIEVYMAMT